MNKPVSRIFYVVKQESEDLFVLFSCSVMTDSLWPMDCSMPGFPVLNHLLELAQTRSSDSVMPSNHLFSVVPFSCLQSFPASGSCPGSWLFTSGGQSIGASASASVLPANVQGWFPLELTGLISLVSRRLSRIFSNTAVRRHQFFGAQLFLLSSSHSCVWLLEKLQLWLCLSACWPLLAKQCLCFLICCLGLSKLFFQGARVF